MFKKMLLFVNAIGLPALGNHKRNKCVKSKKHRLPLSSMFGFDVLARNTNNSKLLLGNACKRINYGLESAWYAAFKLADWSQASNYKGIGLIIILLMKFYYILLKSGPC